MAVGVGDRQAVQFGENDGLNDGEALGGAIAQIALRLLAVEAMKKLPGGISQVEERPTVLLHEKAFVRTDFQARQSAGVGWTAEGGSEGAQNQQRKRSTGKAHMASCLRAEISVGF
jgi:hypothetical protein